MNSCSSAHQADKGLAALSVSKSFSSAFVFPPSELESSTRARRLRLIVWCGYEARETLTADSPGIWESRKINKATSSLQRDAAAAIGLALRPSEQKLLWGLIVLCSEGFEETMERIGYSLTTESWPKPFLRFCAVPDPESCQKKYTQNHLRNMSVIQSFGGQSFLSVSKKTCALRT